MAERDDARGSADRPPPSSRRAGPGSSIEKAPASPTRRRLVGRIELRLTVAVVIMTVLPFVVGVGFATYLVRRQAEYFYNPRIGRELEAALDVYRPLVRALKDDMKHRADAIALGDKLRAAAVARDGNALKVELEGALRRYGDRVDPVTNDAPLVEIVTLQVFSDLSLEECLEEYVLPAGSVAARGPAPSAMPSGAPSAMPAPKPRTPLAAVGREAPLNSQRDYALVQCRSLGAEDGATTLVATFSTERSRVDHLRELDEFVAIYREVERRRDEWARLNFAFFAALLAGSILLAAGVGFAFARSVSRRVSRVGDAARRVAGGDLEVRVPEEGADEVGELAVSFNRMLGEIERSRARIEYLQRIGEWQDMARRLAHEVKNPLTPIQLAVEECHSKYNGDDPRMRRLLDTTLEIVTEEVGTLRRLVSEFSDFARLPRARLEEADLSALLREVKPTLERLGLGTEPGDLLLTPSGGQAIPVKVTVDAEVKAVSGDGAAAPVLALVDRQMLRKALDNLARNAVQAIRAKAQGYRVLLHATRLPDGRLAIDVDDDGPGVAEELRPRIFDPYFTTRTEGTGLGLAIVKKIVVEHGGTIECDRSPQGGARFRIVLPSPEGQEALAAREASTRDSDAGPESSRSA